MKYCVNLTNGGLLGWTEALAKRPDFITYAHALKRDMAPVVRHEPQGRLDADPVRIDSTYENSCPAHLLPFTQVAERFPQFFYDRNSNILELRGLFRTGVLAGCVYECGGRAYLGLAETVVALDKAQNPIEEYAEFHQQALLEAKSLLRDAPSRAVEGCNQRLAVAQEKADSAQAAVDAIRSEAAGMDILGQNFNMDKLVAIRRDYQKAAGRLDAETKRLQSAQADLDEAKGTLDAAELKNQAKDEPEPAFKAPRQAAFAKSLGISERKLRDLLDAFRIDRDIDSLRWARMTEQQFSRFNRWLESQEAAA